MDEALICLRERATGKLVKAFWDLAMTLPSSGGWAAFSWVKKRNEWPREHEAKKRQDQAT